jgi:large subunit ribosomal protein L15
MVEKKDKKKPSRVAAARPAARAKAKPPVRKAAARPVRKASPLPERRRSEPADQSVAAPAAETAPVTVPAAAFAGIHGLRPSSGATHSRKRVGRGPGSGHGKTAGRGYKGQKSRTGYRHQRGFEGGQMPLHRRVPKRGFTNIFRVEYDIVNLSDLDRFEAGAAVTPASLAEARLARASRPVKILGGGEIAKPLNVSAHKFSAGARARIEAAGGRCEVIPR